MLIGKNNSGKSNILSGISSFFTCIGSGRIVASEPHIARDIDFFNGGTGNPIDLGIVFALSLAERDSLIQSIISEAPQMKNAVEGLDPHLQLSVTVRMVSSPRRFAFVHELAFGRADDPVPQHSLCKIGADTAVELYDRAHRLTDKRSTLEVLGNIASRFDVDDWERMRGEWRGFREQGMPPAHFLFQRFGIHRREVDDRAMSVLQDDVAPLLREESYSDFKSGIDSLIKTTSEQLEASESASLTNSIATFSGQETEVPHFVQQTLNSPLNNLPSRAGGDGSWVGVSAS